MSHKDAKNRTKDQMKDQTKDTGSRTFIKFGRQNYGSQVGVNNGSIDQYILDGRTGRSRHIEPSERTRWRDSYLLLLDEK